MQQTILTEVDAGVGIITLNCPERHNAFDDVLISELTQAIKMMTQNAAVRVIVLSSNGKSFCAGADLNWMRRAAGYSDAEIVEVITHVGLNYLTNIIGKASRVDIDFPKVAL